MPTLQCVCGGSSAAWEVPASVLVATELFDCAPACQLPVKFWFDTQPIHRLPKGSFCRLRDVTVRTGTSHLHSLINQPNKPDVVVWRGYPGCLVK
jgi:hypothetical protein